MKSTLRRSALVAALAVPAAAVGADEDRDLPARVPEPRSAFELSLSGQHRARFEHLDAQFRPLLDETDQALALRTTVLFEAKGARWQFVGELMDSRAELNDAGSTLNGAIVDAAEPLQVVASRTWRRQSDGDDGPYRSETALRFGRMTFDLGKRRLIARNGYRNTANSFLGVDWQWQDARGRTVRLFHLKPMQALPANRDALLDNHQQLDRTARGTALRGLYYGFPAFGAARAELYWLDLDAEEASAPRDLTTVGTRLYRAAAPSRWHYELEAMRQSGRSTGTVGGERRSGLDHDAEFYHGELGYSLAAAWAPVVAVQYDLASGDEDPADTHSNRFDTLYGARRFDFGPTGIHGPFARANLESFGVQASFRPTPRWRAMLWYRAYRLAESRDAWTTTGLRDDTGSSGDDLGRQIEASFTWDVVDDRLQIETGAAHFAKGGFVEQTAAALSGPSTYFHAAVVVTF